MCGDFAMLSYVTTYVSMDPLFPASSFFTKIASIDISRYTSRTGSGGAGGGTSSADLGGGPNCKCKYGCRLLTVKKDGRNKGKVCVDSKGLYKISNLCGRSSRFGQLGRRVSPYIGAPHVMSLCLLWCSSLQHFWGCAQSTRYGRPTPIHQPFARTHTHIHAQTTCAPSMQHYNCMVPA